MVDEPESAPPAISSFDEWIAWYVGAQVPAKMRFSVAELQLAFDAGRAIDRPLIAKAAGWFREYESSHRAKLDNCGFPDEHRRNEEKADRNAERAAELEAALAGKPVQPESETDESAAEIGRALIEAIEDVRFAGSPLDNWQPADSPVEVVADLVNMVCEARTYSDEQREAAAAELRRWYQMRQAPSYASHAIDAVAVALGLRRAGQ